MTDDKQAPEPMRCHTCKHYRVDHSMRDYALEYQMGECVVKMSGDIGPDINLVSGWDGAYVASVDVDALWGCRSWEGKSWTMKS